MLFHIGTTLLNQLHHIKEGVSDGEASGFHSGGGGFKSMPERRLL
jgi:hypothetical protein